MLRALKAVMYLEIENFLTPEEVQTASSIADSGTFVDGLVTAPDLESLKNNQQLNPSTTQFDELRDIFLNAIARSDALKLFTHAKSIRAPILSRYKDGMRYGRHLDAPILQRGTPMRTDLSMTVFLAEPSSYDGGALVLDTEFGKIARKLSAGSAICYSTFLWHEVEPVTRGERLALITWMQSRISDPQKRALLFDIGTASRDIALALPESDASERLKRAYNNMVRLWSDV